MTFILAKKLKMTTVFTATGDTQAVTLLQAGPCKVTQVRTKEKDGYEAVQIGFGAKKKLNLPTAGHLKDLPNFRNLREFKGAESATLKRGDEITVAAFKPGDVIDLRGTTKGKGFAGVIKRHHFHGGPASHGSQSHRLAGSSGMRFPQHTIRGKKLPGQLGNKPRTMKNVRVVDVDLANNLLVIAGAVPGHVGSIIEVTTAKTPKKSQLKK
jgi:large subunit ribosomal protein L3